LARIKIPLAIVGAALVVAPASCRRASPEAPASAPPAATVAPPVATQSPDPGGDLASLERALPAVAGAFRGGPIERHDGFVRRRYERGVTRIEITIAYRPQRGDDYQQWVTAARDYPAAPLDLPPAEALGFFTCGRADGRSACDLHVQLRAGYHVEVIGGGTATRADLEQLMVAVPMSALVAPR
jgi:hypothetical protein